MTTIRKTGFTPSDAVSRLRELHPCDMKFTAFEKLLGRLRWAGKVFPYEHGPFSQGFSFGAGEMQRIIVLDATDDIIVAFHRTGEFGEDESYYTIRESRRNNLVIRYGKDLTRKDLTGLTGKGLQRAKEEILPMIDFIMKSPRLSGNISIAERQIIERSLTELKRMISQI